MIESVDNEKIKYYRKLKTKKYIDIEGKFLVEGFHLVDEAIKKGIVIEVLLLKDVKTIFSGPKITVSEKVMQSLTNMETIPPIIAVCEKIRENDIGKKIIILDGVQDPGNAGTIIRNAAAFDVDTIIFSEDSVNVYNDKVIRSSQGMLFHVNILTRDLTSVIKELKERNIRVIGTALKNAVPLSEIEKTDNYAVILGNEGAGIKQEILNLCDEIVKIEMNDKCESLNVGVSSGIILYYLR